MEIQNSDWRVVKDEETGVVSLYKQGVDQPALITTIEAFRALRAIVEQIG